MKDNLRWARKSLSELDNGEESNPSSAQGDKKRLFFWKWGKMETLEHIRV